MWISSEGSAKGALRRILQTVEERYKRKFKSQERSSAQERRAGNKIQTAHGTKTLFKVLFHSKIAIKLSLLQTEVKDSPQVTIYNPQTEDMEEPVEQLHTATVSQIHSKSQFAQR